PPPRLPSFPTRRSSDLVPHGHSRAGPAHRRHDGARRGARLCDDPHSQARCPMMLSAQDLVWRAGRRAIVDRVSLDVRPGEFLGLVGPNGSGKTSLIAMLAGLRAPASGTVTLDGTPLARMRRRALARPHAPVEQQAEPAERLTAREAVALGRTPHLSALSPWSSRDDAIVDKAMADVDMAHLASRSWQTLSGGE